MEENKLTLEVIVHFTDKAGNRIAPMCNRIKIPLQVTEINNTEHVLLTKTICDNLCAIFAEAEYLQRLVLVPERAEKLEAQYGSGYCKLYALDVFPINDNIEIQDILHKAP